MVTAIVNGEAVRIPQRFEVEEWCRLQKWDFDSKQQWPKILEEVTGISADVYREADPESIDLFMGFVISAMNARKKIELPDFNKLKFGQFVDMDCYMAIGIDKQLQAMLEILGVDTPWAPEAIWTIEQFSIWRTSIYRKYAQLFGLNDKDFHDFSKDKEDEEGNPLDVARGWYTVIVELANDDILQMDAVTEEPLEKVLTFLQIRKEKLIKEANEARKIRKQV